VTGATAGIGFPPAPPGPSVVPGSLTGARVLRAVGSALAVVLANVAIAAYAVTGASAVAPRPAPLVPSPVASLALPSPATTTRPLDPPSVTTPAPAPGLTPAPAEPVVPQVTAPPRPVAAAAGPPGLPAYGHATAWGCAAALAYLQAYAAPQYALVCPGDAGGAQALTCFGDAPCAPLQRLIVIADPCPAAYMNEAHNSWVLNYIATGSAALPGVHVPPPDGSTAIDPWGSCR